MENEYGVYDELPRRSAKKRSPSLFAAIFTYAFCTIVAVGFGVMVAIQFGWIPPLLLGPGLDSPQGKAAQPGPTTVTVKTFGGGGGSAPARPSLPDCSTVQNSTTACQGQPQVAEVQPTPLAYCEDVLAGQGIVACQWRDAEAARLLQEQTEREALQLWINMADEAIEQDLRGAGPTAEVPTECAAPANDRARASCELIKRGIIHPKG